MIIAIDGPTGSGKSTVARRLAQRIGFFYLNTGATYRALGLAVWRKTGKKEQFSVEEVLRTLEGSDFKVTFLNGEFKIYLDGEDITELIETEEVGRLASLVARFPEVKERLFEFQRKIVNNCNAVVEGRDAGLYVFPDAEVKIFLTASAEERARRRYLQLKEIGKEVDYEEILKAVKERDERDQNRPLYPFKPAPDAVVIDTTNLGPDDVLQKVFKIVEPHLNVFITGIGSGLGRALAKEFLKRGYKIFALSRHLPEEFRDHPKVNFVKTDLSELENVKSNLLRLFEGFKGSLPWVILNAGTLGRIVEMDEVPLKELKEVTDINLWSNKLILDTLKEFQKENRIRVGQIIAISSGAAVNCNKGWNAYSISKAALNCTVKLYSWEYEKSHLISLAPGLIWTPMLQKVVETNEERFPSIKRLKESPKHSPESGAKMLLEVFPNLNRFPSGSFVDVRTYFGEIYRKYLPKELN